MIARLFGRIGIALSLLGALSFSAVSQSLNAPIVLSNPATGGGGSGAPTDATYYVTTSNATLTNEVVPSANVQTLLGAADFAAVRTSLGLVIGTNVQAFDSDLTTWAGITPAANCGTFLATPTGANLAACETDETGTGANVHATSPALVTPALGAATATSVTASGLLQAGTTLGISTDVLLNRDAANVLSLKNGATAQAFRVYNDTDGTNSRWADIGFSSNDLVIRSNGSGTFLTSHPQIHFKADGFRFFTNNGTVQKWFLDANGFYPGSDNSTDIGLSSLRPRDIHIARSLLVEGTNTAGGTTGAQTINKASGTVNFAASATSLVVTDSLVTTSSIVMAVVRTNDATAAIKNVVPAAGSFTINLSAAATAETSVGFFVVEPE